MYNTAKTAIWYGELRTSRGNTIVIHNKNFPDATPGRVYLYNTEKDAIIEYAEEIVQGNLHDLRKPKAQAAADEFGAAFAAACEAFMEKHDGWVEANATKHKPLLS